MELQAILIRSADHAVEVSNKIKPATIARFIICSFVNSSGSTILLSWPLVDESMISLASAATCFGVLCGLDHPPTYVIWSDHEKVNEKMAVKYTGRFVRTSLATGSFLLAMTALAAGQTKVRLCWTSFASNMSGSWVAYEEGLFKKNGLDVELIHIPSTSRAIQAMLAGEMAYSYTDGRTAVQAAMKGADVVMLAGAANRFVFSFMARPEIKKISDLRGRKIGITRFGSSTHTVTQWTMSHAGIKAEEYQVLQVVDVPNMLTAMLAGQIDAGALFPPTHFRASKGGLKAPIYHS